MLPSVIMADCSFENKQKWKKVYKSSPIAIVTVGPPEEMLVKFSNTLCHRYFIFT